jgi:hypothetical protein
MRLDIEAEWDVGVKWARRVAHSPARSVIVVSPRNARKLERDCARRFSRLYKALNYACRPDIDYVVSLFVDPRLRPLFHAPMQR